MEKQEWPPRRANCILKGDPLEFGGVGRIEYIYSEHGVLRAAVYWAGALSTGFTLRPNPQYVPVSAIEWWIAPVNENKPGGRGLPARPKNWKEYANVSAATME